MDEKQQRFLEVSRVVTSLVDHMDEARETELVRREQEWTLVKMAFKSQEVEKRAEKHGIQAGCEGTETERQTGCEREKAGREACGERVE